MLKGWVEIKGDLARICPEQAGNVYYYDKFTGAMAKGDLVIDGKLCHFDEVTGLCGKDKQKRSQYLNEKTDLRRSFHFFLANHLRCDTVRITLIATCSPSK